jgi:hypothetical protein
MLLHFFPDQQSIVDPLFLYFPKRGFLSLLESDRCTKMTTGESLRELTDLELQERATELGLDPYGPRATLIAKIEGLAHLQNANGTAVAGKKTGKADKEANKKVKKRRRKKRVAAPSRPGDSANTTNGEAAEDDEEMGQIDIEYVPESLHFDPAFSEFATVFAKFQALGPQQQALGETSDGEQDNEANHDTQQVPMDADVSDASKSSDDEEEGDGDPNQPLSKKRLKKLMRLSVAELKRLARKPEVVEVRFWLVLLSMSLPCLLLI